MSRRTINITVEAGWQPTDTIHVYRGTENAADLAASSTVRLVKRVKVGNASAGSVVAISFDYTATDKCGTLPMGVSVKDQAGNESNKTESVLQLMDPPRPPGRPDVTATANPGEATLSWLASDDV